MWKIVNVAYNITEPNIGLRLNRESSALKCYMGDADYLYTNYVLHIDDVKE